MTTLKKGDHVRVTDTIEGEVRRVDEDGFSLEDGRYVSTTRGSLMFPWKRTVEKVAPPEPEWVNGDVVKVGNWVPAYWFDGRWYGADRKLHVFSGAGGSAVTLSDYWRSGSVEILVKMAEGPERQEQAA